MECLSISFQVWCQPGRKEIPIDIKEIENSTGGAAWRGFPFWGTGSPDGEPRAGSNPVKTGLRRDDPELLQAINIGLVAHPEEFRPSRMHPSGTLHGLPQKVLFQLFEIQSRGGKAEHPGGEHGRLVPARRGEDGGRGLPPV